MPELIQPGVNGWLVETVEQATAAVEEIARLDRTSCRRVFEDRFTATRMAKDYLEVYQQLVCKGAADGRGALHAANISLPANGAGGGPQPPASLDRSRVDGSPAA
jgi:hypothetical protein